MIEVTVRYSKSVQANPQALEQLIKPMALAQAVAERFKVRVAQEGRTATPAKEYASERQAELQAKATAAKSKAEAAAQRFQQHYNNRTLVGAAQLRKSKAAMVKARANAKSAKRALDGVKPYIVSEAYAQKLGLQERAFRSSRDFHAKAGAKPGAANVTGGMWSGLQVRNYGQKQAVVDFGGSSLGATSERTSTKSGRLRSKPRSVRNQLKAATVFRFSKVNVLEPTDAEEQAMVSAVSRWSQKFLEAQFGAQSANVANAGDQQLLAKIMQLSP